MYSALSLVVSAFAVVVLPVQGVPVMRMTRLFMKVLVWLRNSYCFRLLIWLLGWRVGVWLSDPKNAGSEETPPTCRIAVLLGQGESLGNGAETKRPPGLGDDTFVMWSVPVWKR